ncbi:YwiC-like family protein [Lusitaniella coriacea]|uniref:YwiC-like family protein n=1 Tax=Lusitaniella coriacea TaxID=1983105 RepID=UPI003CF82732
MSKVISQPNKQPMFSPEHGVYVVLFGSFLSGTALAQHWTLATTLAFCAAFLGFQAEYPWEMQVKQRKSLKPRFLFWGSLYSLGAAGIALWLYFQAPVLLWIYLGAIAALIIDLTETWFKARKSIANELVTFAAVCLCAPFAYAATTGTLSLTAMGLWLLNTCYFSSSIFSVKLRKPKTNALLPGILYHAIAAVIVTGLYLLGGLSLATALAFSLALLKFGLIAGRKEWYCNAPIQTVAILETSFALGFIAIVALSVLPAHLPV